MPRAVESGKVQSGINVTPLVDVVLVLLIIFMIVAPRLESDASVNLPETDRPDLKPDDGRQIVVTVQPGGTLWIDTEETTEREFPGKMIEAAAGREDWKVVIKGDARLTFGEVQRTMLAIERAGFADVGLITERRRDS